MRNAMWVGGGITGMGEIPILGVKEKGIAKVIRDIFRNGEQGFYYDPRDMGAMYQDAAGATAVNATGQPVGLMYDKSKPITNISILDNTFLLADGWLSNNPEVSVSSVDGSLRVSKGAVSPNSVYKIFSCERNKLYRLSVKYKNHTGNNVRVYVRNTAGSGLAPSLSQSIQTFAATDGEGSSFFISAADVHSVVIDSQNASDSSIDVESIVITKVSDSVNHAYQTTSAARPLFQQSPILGSELLPVAGSFNEGGVGWFTNGGWAYTEGAAVSTGGLTGLKYIMPTPAVTSMGKPYTISMVIRSKGTQGSIGVSFSDGGVLTKRWELKDIENGSVLTQSGTISGNAHLYIMTNDGWDGSIESVSIKEVTGYRADTAHIAYDGVDDKLVTNFPTPLTNATVLRSIPNVGTQVKYKQTLPVLYEDSTNHSGLIAVDRALTPQEQLRLMSELDRRAGVKSLEATVDNLFDNNQVGFVYDPNDLSSMFQDATGSVPVTAAGQPVGMILDKSKPITNTPVLNSAFLLADGWIKSNPEISVTNVGGSLRISKDALLQKNIYKPFSCESGKLYRLTVKYKNRTGNNVRFFIRNANGSGVNPVLFQTIQSFTKTEGEEVTFFISSSDTHSVSIDSQNASASSVDVETISITKVSDAINHAYQSTSASRPILRKNAETGANYLEFDGSDDFLQTANIDFSGTDEMTVIAAIRGIGTTLNSIVIESSPSGFATNGSFGVRYPGNIGVTSTFTSRGTVYAQTNTGSTLRPPQSLVLSGSAKISTAAMSIRANGIAYSEKITQGSGNYGNHPVYIGRREGTSLPFVGHIYGLITVGKLIPESEVKRIEQGLANYLGVTLNV